MLEIHQIKEVMLTPWKDPQKDTKCSIVCVTAVLSVCMCGLSVFSQRTLWCRVCISNENLWCNTCTELTKTKQHLLCCCEAEVSCVWAFAIQRDYTLTDTADSGTFIMLSPGTTHADPLTELPGTTNADYQAASSMDHYESKMTHLNFGSWRHNTRITSTLSHTAQAQTPLIIDVA